MPRKGERFFTDEDGQTDGEIFNINFEYIKSSLSKVDNVDYSFMDMAKIFGVTKVTIYRWLKIEKVPNISNLNKICEVLKSRLNWSVQPVDLYDNIIKSMFNLDKVISKKDEEYKKLYKVSKLDHKKISNRLRELRQKRGWSLKDVERLSFKLFPNDTNYHISHVHIADIEKHKVKNYHINKIRTLSVIYNTTLDYILFGTEIPEAITIDKENNLLIIPLADLTSTLSEDQILAAAEEFVKSLKKL